MNSLLATQAPAMEDNARMHESLPWFLHQIVKNRLAQMNRAKLPKQNDSMPRIFDFWMSERDRLIRRVVGSAPLADPSPGGVAVIIVF